MIGVAIVLLGLAIVWLLGDRKIRERELDTLRHEHKQSLHALSKHDPLHPMCRCHVLPVGPLQNLKLVDYGIPHVVRENGVIEISLVKLTSIQAQTWKFVARFMFDVSEDPSRPGVVIASEKDLSPRFEIKHVRESERRYKISDENPIPEGFDVIAEIKDMLAQLPEGFRFVAEGEIEPIHDVDAQFLRMSQGATFRSTTLPSGAITPDYFMVASGGVLKRIP